MFLFHIHIYTLCFKLEVEVLLGRTRSRTLGIWLKDKSCVGLSVLSERDMMDVRGLNPGLIQSFSVLFQSVTKPQVTVKEVQ